jgi:hypothetical protein
MVRRLYLLLMLVPLLAHRGNAQRFFPTGVDDKDVAAYVTRLQRAVGAGERGTVADLVAYPLHVNRGPRQHTLITSRDELLRRYDTIFTPAIRRAIVDERFANLSATSDGVAIARGAVWLRGICTRTHPVTCHMAVWSINLPAAG